MLEFVVMSADSLIYVQDLSKHFRSFKRREGVRGSIQNLFVREYKTVAAVERVSFSIERGEMVGYIGPNGAGKSTTIKMLTGILVPSSRRDSHQRLRSLSPAHASM